MTDIPDDLTDVGAHHGNDPPPETGQTVRSPEGPDPSAADAQPSPALFQVIRASSPKRLVVRAHSARAEVSASEEGEEEGRYRTVAALRAALADEGIDEMAAVFDDAETDRRLVESDVSADHVWIGQPRYPTITFFQAHKDARAFAGEEE
ncbi:MAG: hypothetical protein ABEL51_11025 [Salinibacter sp.]